GCDQLAQYSHCQVRLADSRGPDEQQAVVQGIVLGKALGPELGCLQVAIGCSLFVLADVEVLKRAVLVAARDAGLREQLLGALRFAARAAGHATDAAGLDRFPSRALAFGTVNSGHCPTQGRILNQAERLVERILGRPRWPQTAGFPLTGC